LPWGKSSKSWGFDGGARSFFVRPETWAAKNREGGLPRRVETLPDYFHSKLWFNTQEPKVRRIFGSSLPRGGSLSLHSYSILLSLIMKLLLFSTKNIDFFLNYDI
jgi:hypothetical protein